MKFLTLLFLAGCAAQLSDDLFKIARACGTAKECPDEWAAWNRAEERKRERQEVRCPPGYIVYSDHWGNRCVSREQASDLFRQFPH